MKHIPVLMNEVIRVLRPQPGEVYVDLTAGYGGHAHAVVEAIKETGEAWLIDQDLDAVNALSERFPSARVHIWRANFAELNWAKLPQPNMILLDLGVNSSQLDERQRGFSFQVDAPLDMRMDNRAGKTAADIVNTASQAELADIFFKYGEERRARAIARKIVAKRRVAPIRTTIELADIVRSIVPSGRIDGATRVFQALRIVVNNELHALEAVLPKAAEALAPGGRLAAISFHSLEDRIVKHFMHDICADICDTITGQTLQESSFRLVTKKPLTAVPEEIDYNPRARSAKLRAVEKKK